MELNNFFSILNGLGINNIFFKIVMIFIAIFYLLYALVISKQVKIMDKTLKDKHNGFIILITSFQLTISMILLILTIFLI